MPVSDIWFYSCMFCMALEVFLGTMILRRLRNNHPQLWHSLGCPSFSAANFSSSRRAFAGFMWKFNFARVGDFYLRNLGFAKVAVDMAVVASLVGLLAS